MVVWLFSIWLFQFPSPVEVWVEKQIDPIDVGAISHSHLTGTKAKLRPNPKVEIFSGDPTLTKIFLIPYGNFPHNLPPFI